MILTLWGKYDMFRHYSIFARLWKWIGEDLQKSELDSGLKLYGYDVPSHGQGQGQGRCSRTDGEDLTMIQVDLIQMDDYPADSCAINPTAFLFCFICCFGRG